MLASCRTMRTCLIILIVLLPGAIHAADPDMALARQDQLSPDCARETGLIELVIDAGEATYNRSDVVGQSSCQGKVFPEQNVLMDGYDSVEVAADGRARLTRESTPLITIYQNSTVTLAAEPEAASESAFQLHIASGAVMVGTPGEDLLPGLQDPAGITPTPTPGQESHAGLVIVTASATFQGNDAAYFLYASPDGIAWLAVTEGQVEMTTTTGDVTVAGGWQTRTGGGESSMIPLPATRSVVDLAYGGDLPGISQLTGDALTDADVFATCRVSSLTGSDIRNDAGMAGAVVRHLGFGSEFGASYRASDTAWVRGDTADDLAGWLESGNINCPYDLALLPVDETVETASVERAGPAATINPDLDADGALNDADNCAEVSNANQQDSDRDGVGDACQVLVSDGDGDGVPNHLDNCINRANPGQEDRDIDGLGDECDGELAGSPQDDIDGDSFSDVFDNCPTVNNDDQADANFNGVGDACEGLPPSDIDGDGSTDVFDNCPTLYNPDQLNGDGDGYGDACETPWDFDEDGVHNDLDNCIGVSNPDQMNQDGDEVGDACDDTPAGASAAAPDSDGDTWPDDIDNCWFYNPEQTDANLNGVGDECDDSPTEVPFTDPDSDGDTWPDNADNCPLDYNPEQEDQDGDGVGDWCDDSPFAHVSPPTLVQ